MPLRTGARLVDQIDLSEQSNGAYCNLSTSIKLLPSLSINPVQQRPMVWGERHADPGSLSHA